MAQFINPFTDIGFKRIFGQEFSKPLLLDFLNNLLKGEREITDITFLDKEQPADFDGGRSLIYDIFCQTVTGEQIIVEMQNREQPYFKKRSLYYVSEAISRQGERGIKWEYGVHAVYFVGFMNFRRDDIGAAFRTDVALMNLQTKEPFSGDIRLIYLQLPYFDKQAEACETDFERWIYVLKNMEALNRLPWAAKNSVFERLSQIAEISQLSREERIKYDAAIRAYRDDLIAMEGAEEIGRQKGIQQGIKKGREEGIREGRKEGIKKGREEGIREGRKEGRLETARQLKSMGISSDIIRKSTGLTDEEISAL